MKAESRNLAYSLLLAAALVIFLVSYFIWMLPSLYLDYMEEQQMEAVWAQQRAYLEHQNYEGITVQNPTACFTVELHVDDDAVLFTNAYLSARFTFTDEALITQYAAFRSAILKRDAETRDFSEQTEEAISELFALLQERVFSEQLPFALEILHRNDGVRFDYEEQIRLRRMSDDVVVVALRANDGINRYTTYAAYSETDGGIVLSVLPAVTSDMFEIRNVVLGSLPMIVGVIVLLVVVFSYIYARGILKPLFTQLAEKNAVLAAENQRKSAFIRSFSHKIRTPIAAALLLVDGMIGCVGSFADTQTNLPKVREQLLTMKQIVDEEKFT